MDELQIMALRNKNLSQRTVPMAFDNYEFVWLIDGVQDDIVEWRNNPRIRQMMRNTDEFNTQTQREFIGAYGEKDRYDFILTEREGRTQIGVFSVSLISKRPELGKYIGNDAYLGKRIAKQATIQLLDYMRKYSGLKVIYAETKKVNHNNIQLNLSLGFEVVEESEDFILMKTVL